MKGLKLNEFGMPMREAAGVLFDCCGLIYLIQRSDDIPDPGLWSIPGGMVEPGEEPFGAALREVEEEIGIVPFYIDTGRYFTNECDDLYYTTFYFKVDECFEGKLNFESQGQGWHSLFNLPQRIHPGVVKSLKKLGITTLA